MYAIYGALFEQGPHAAVLPDLASGYRYSNGNKTLTIAIRPGVKFSDGTPFTAAAVKANIDRVLQPSFGCACDADFSVVQSTTVQGNNVVLDLKAPDAGLIEAFVTEAPTWVPSPTALASEGAATFAQKPIGAGPFEVVTNSANDQITLKANPGYWQKGEPHLSGITFTALTADQTGYTGLQSGDLQVVSDVTTVPLIKQSAAQFSVDAVPPTSNQAVQMNTKSAPLNNRLVREALQYATNPQQVGNALYGNLVQISQSPTAPADIAYEQHVPGYRTYNLAKAKALVRKVGGISVKMIGVNTAIATETLEALQNQWTAAGIKVTIDPLPKQQEIADLHSGNWQLFLSSEGNVDPDVGNLALPTRVSCTGTLTGVCDSGIDGLITQSSQILQKQARVRVFQKIFKSIDDQAYFAFLFPVPQDVISAKSVQGINANTYAASPPFTYWENVSVSS